VLFRLTDLEITENILLLLLAGHDTSSTTLTRLLSVLHDNPDVVQQLRQEQAAVMARHGEQLTAAAIKDMEYADAVIRYVIASVCSAHVTAVVYARLAAALHHSCTILLDATAALMLSYCVLCA
jgi:cytochrome P450